MSISTGSKTLLGAIAAGIAVFFAASPTQGQFNPIEFGVLSRSGGQVGTEFDVRTATGNRIEEIERLLFSDPRITAELATLDPLAFSDQRLPNHGNFRVKVASDVPEGRYEVRAIGRHGVSNPRVFFVSRLPSVVPKSISHLATAATPLPLNEIVHAISTAAAIDYFTLPLQEGQRVHVDLLAQQLDSWTIGHLKVMDPQGSIVVTARGSDGVDPQLAFTAERSGDYILTVHDFLYRGGEEFFYQLVARSGDEIERELVAGGNVPRWWNPASITLTPVDPVSVEESEVQPITPPCEIASVFGDRNDEDVFEFSANEGDQFVVELVSHRMGQPTDARLRILRSQPQQAGDPTWQEVATADDSQNVGGADMPLGSKDPVVLFKAPGSGTYRVVVRDLDTGESLGSAQRYVLVIRKPQPRFDLLAYMPYPHKDAKESRHFGSKLFRGGSEAIRVVAVRHDGWAGPIEISVTGLPEGVSCAAATLAANQNETQVTLVASEDVTSSYGPIEVIGKGVVDGQEMVRAATPATYRWGRGHTRDFVQSRLTSDLVISTSDKDVAPLSIQIGDSSQPEVKKNTSLNLPIKLIRREGGKAACVLRARDLPPGVTMGEVTIAADKSEGNLELKVAAGAASGTYSLWLQAETKIKIKPNPQVHQRAQDYRSQLQKLHDDPAQAANLEAIKAAITAADERVKTALPNAKEQELTVFIPSPHVTIRVVDP